MILEMKQIRSHAEGAEVPTEYGFYKNGKILASFYADEPVCVFPSVKFEAIFKGENNYKIILEKNEKCPQGYKNGMLTYQSKKEDGTKIGISKYEFNHYNSNNELIGKIRQIFISPKKKFFEAPKAYNYQEFDFKGEIYDMYDVRIRGTGMFCCIYKDNQQVAMIKRNLPVINWLDNYIIYALDNIDIELLFLAAAHNDYLNFPDPVIPEDAGVVYRTEDGVSDIEYRKDILDKYDPNFRQKILEMEKGKEI